MKLVIVGNEEECLGFSLAGVEGVIVEDRCSNCFWIMKSV